MSLTDDQLSRYARHLILREVGGVGQQKLIDARVLIVGAGGLGSPALPNLQRQIAHTTQDIGRLKVESASDHARAINPDTHINRHATRLAASNALELVKNYDIVLDGSDNFATRFLVNDACYLGGRTL